jgi:SecDF, P1 head subdomain
MTGRRRRASALLAVAGLAAPVLMAACSSPTEVAFKSVPGTASFIPPAEDVPVIDARLHALGDTKARVTVQGHTLDVQGGGALPAPKSFFVETGMLTLRPVYCFAPAYSPPAPGTTLPRSSALPSCSAAYVLSAGNLDVDETTGQPGSSIPADPGFADYPSTTAHDAQMLSTTVLLPRASETGGGDQRYVLGPAEVTNADIGSAEPVFATPNWMVSITLTDAGERAWNQLARQSFHAYVGVDLDDAVISAPLVEPSQSSFASFGDKFELEGNFTKTSALRMAALLSSGPLPAPLTAG